MKILVSGSGLVATSAVDALLQHGHAVRLLAPDAGRAATAWPHGVEPWPGDAARTRGLAGVADGCEAIVHVALPAPGTTDAARTIVRAARHMVAEAERAEARLVVVSALEAADGGTEEADALAKAEAMVTGSPTEGTVVRTGVVYGPGEGLIAFLLRLVRSLPAIPLPAGGDRRLQPVWHADVGRALAAAALRTDLGRQVLEIAGPERASVAEIVDRLCALAGRQPTRVPIPGVLATMGAEMARLAGLAIRLTAAETALLDTGESLLRDNRVNALQAVLGVVPTPLAAGLERLAAGTPEQAPAEGVGPMVERRYWIDIERPARRAREMRDDFRHHALEILDARAPRAAARPGPVRKGSRIWMRVPARGDVGLRIAEVAPDHLTALTLEGHPLSALVTFTFLERGQNARFEVKVQARASEALDRVAQVLGGILTDVDWTAVVLRVAARSGGRAPEGVQTAARTLDTAEAEAVEARAEALLVRARREVKRPRAKAEEPVGMLAS